MSTKKKPAGNPNRRYRVSYALNHEKEGVSAETLMEKGLGGCDAVLLASIVRPPDGSLSILYSSLDGDTGDELDGIELFKVWSLMMDSLIKSKTLPRGQKQFVEAVFETYRKLILSGREPTPPAKA